MKNNSLMYFILHALRFSFNLARTPKFSHTSKKIKSDMTIHIGRIHEKRI